jgi:hypothetical protein
MSNSGPSFWVLNGYQKIYHKHKIEEKGGKGYVICVFNATSNKISVIS